MSETTVTEQAAAASELNSKMFAVVQEALDGQLVSMSDVVAGLEFVKFTCLAAHMKIINTED